MFTGIIETLGTLAALTPREGDFRLRIACPGLDLSGARLGDSIAVNGACLTAVELQPEAFAADVSRETLSLTTLGRLGVGDRVNLETALKAGAPLGGHLVSGHVDGIGRVQSLARDARSWRVGFEVPPELARYIARKGSICIDGVSLTVNEVEGAHFGVNIVPHTWDVTTFSGYRVGTPVNLEVDLLARYLERLLEAGVGRPKGLDADSVRSMGYGQARD
ncbi:MAG: riboflavin synthase [Gammaproteobacteria bacterium]|nr:riboflavin synthase [Gammaproteobacteria bacterium]TVQ47388.1 MAG: riboflavin synthase [Gammaproteobacteria bacterium]